MCLALQRRSKSLQRLSAATFALRRQPAKVEALSVDPLAQVRIALAGDTLSYPFVTETVVAVALGTPGQHHAIRKIP